MPSPAAMYEVAVIIPHYNDVARLERCLEALMPQVTDDVEVVIADNNSTDSLWPVTSRWPDVRVVIQTEKGAGPARNAGVAATTAPWLMFLDADCVASPGWLARGREIGEDGAVIGGRVDVFHETPPPQSGAEAFETVFAFHMQAYLDRDAFLGSGNLVTTRAVFETVGGFRPAVSEDKDWSQRAARAGFRLGFDDAFAAGHPSRQDWPALRHKWRRLTSEAFLLDGQGGLSRLKWALKALLMPVSAVVHAPKVLTHPELNTGEKARALLTLARVRLCRMLWMLRQVATNRA
ncbi:MAG: glycosyltransferase family A protein [Pseudomonadota bacterium]